jgi:hypothetical protein
LNAYETLGVATTASDAQIAVAYRQLARQFHPDAHPGARPAERRRYQEAMSRINAAHDLLKDPARRQAYDSAPEPEPRGRPPGSNECDLCGYAPAAQFAFSYQQGKITSAFRYSVSAKLCQQCAYSVGRAEQNKTLITGWWGLFAFFTNFVVVFNNASALQRARQLGIPRPIPGVVAPLSKPLDPGKSVLQRRGAAFAAVVLTVVIGVAALSIANYKPSPHFAKGYCVTVNGGKAKAVNCSDPHDGVIVDKVSSKDACISNGYVVVGSDIYCVNNGG